MKYLLLIYGNEAGMLSASQEAVGQMMAAYGAYTEAMKKAGYNLGVSLETHWRDAGTPEESSRQSWAGMKADLQKAGALS